MAARFWIGGGTTTSWNASPTTNWAATSGGAVRVAAPTSADDVTFDGAGASGNTVSVVTASNCLSFTVTSGYTSTITFGANLNVAGNITLGVNMGIAGNAQLISSAAGTLTSNGITYPAGITFQTAGATRTFADAWTLTGTVIVNFAMTITINGLLTAGGFTWGTVNLTLAGTSGFTVDTFLGSPTTALTLTLTNTNTYTVNNSFTVSASSLAQRATITSSHASNKVTFTLKMGATCATNANYTRIDATGGRRINTFNGTVTTCFNVSQYNDIAPPATGVVSTAGATY